MKLKNEAMEQHDRIIEWKNEKEKSRYFDMVNKFINKVGSSSNKWQEQNDSSGESSNDDRTYCGDGICEESEDEEYICPINMPNDRGGNFT